MTLATKIEKTCKLCIKTVRKKSKKGQKEPKTWNGRRKELMNNAENMHVYY
jgi:hypothetical protein